MKEAMYSEAMDAFCNPFHEFTIEPVSGGLIHHSYKITSRTSGDCFLLQQINDHVFHNPVQVRENYEAIWNHLMEGEAGVFVPEPKLFPGDTTLFCDSRHHYWRVFEFIPGSQMVSFPESPEQAWETAATFGRFTAAFDDFDTNRLHITIPGFHDLSARYRQFEKSLHTRDLSRLQRAANLVQELKKRERYASLYDVFTESDVFLQRVMHHDAKIANVLFDQDTGQVLCPVDLDTVMPGYFFSDLGDMIRTMTCSACEESVDLSSIHIREEYYDALIEGYQESMNNSLTDAEQTYLHHAGLLMTCMQSLRFLTDYLNGDVYYQTTYPEQNFDRAQNQFVLLHNLEAFLKKKFRIGE